MAVQRRRRRRVCPSASAAASDPAGRGQRKSVPQSGMHDFRRGISGVLLSDVRDLRRELFLLCDLGRDGNQSFTADHLYLPAIVVYFSKLSGQSINQSTIHISTDMYISKIKNHFWQFQLVLFTFHLLYPIFQCPYSLFLICLKFLIEISVFHRKKRIFPFYMIDWLFEWLVYQ